MSDVLHLASWYPNANNPLEAPFIKEHFDALHGCGRHELWHVQVRDDGPVLGWRWGKMNRTERYALLFARLPSGRLQEWLTLLMLILVRLRLGRRWWDVVHVHVAYPLLRFPRLFRLLYGQQVLITEHWSAFHRGFNLPPASPARQRIASIFHGGIPVAAVSKALLADITAFAGTSDFPHHVVPNVVDPHLFYPANPPRSCRAPVCLMVATWAPIKRPLLAMEAFAQTLARWPDAQLRVVGGGPQFSAMQAYVRQAGLEPHISLLGPLNKPAIAALMREVDIFLHPSAYETFSVVCAEALCSGLPVVASRVGGIPEFVDDSNGLLVRNTVVEWNEALDIAFTTINQWDRATIASTARQQFHPKAIGNRLQTIYRALQNSGA